MCIKIPLPAFILVPFCCSVSKSLTLCHPVDCSPRGSSAHGVPQARTLRLRSLLQGSSQLSWIEPTSAVSPALADGFFNRSCQWSPGYWIPDRMSFSVRNFEVINCPSIQCCIRCTIFLPVPLCSSLIFSWEFEALSFPDVVEFYDDTPCCVS